MDSYTEETRMWLNERFRHVESDGIYTAHQPIYGFRNGHSEPWRITRYIVTHQIMRELSHLSFRTLLDVGAAEGYNSAIVRDLFSVESRAADLSQEACNRASEIFGLKADAVDVHNLPYANDEFDVVLASQILEHVADLDTAVSELLRVAKSAVVITVPREEIHPDGPHGHVGRFDSNSFRKLRLGSFAVNSRTFTSKVSRKLAALVEGEPRPYQANSMLGRAFVAAYNSAIAPICRTFLGDSAATLVVSIDSLLSKLPEQIRGYESLLITILKDGATYRRHSRKKILASQIVRYVVPYHRLSNT